jgi:hypothetical protein
VPARSGFPFARDLRGGNVGRVLGAVGHFGVVGEIRAQGGEPCAGVGIKIRGQGLRSDAG